MYRRPKVVKALRDTHIPITDIACGANHTAVVDVASQMRTFGRNTSGVLGREVPDLVQGDHASAQFAADARGHDTGKDGVTGRQKVRPSSASRLRGFVGRSREQAAVGEGGTQGAQRGAILPMDDVSLRAIPERSGDVLVHGILTSNFANVLRNICGPDGEAKAAQSWRQRTWLQPTHEVEAGGETVAGGRLPVAVSGKDQVAGFGGRTLKQRPASATVRSGTGISGGTKAPGACWSVCNTELRVSARTLRACTPPLMPARRWTYGWWWGISFSTLLLCCAQGFEHVVADV